MSRFSRVSENEDLLAVPTLEKTRKSLLETQVLAEEMPDSRTRPPPRHALARPGVLAREQPPQIAHEQATEYQAGWIRQPDDGVGGVPDGRAMADEITVEHPAGLMER